MRARPSGQVANSLTASEFIPSSLARPSPVASPSGLLPPQLRADPYQHACTPSSITPPRCSSSPRSPLALPTAGRRSSLVTDDGSSLARLILVPVHPMIDVVGGLLPGFLSGGRFLTATIPTLSHLLPEVEVGGVELSGLLEALPILDGDPRVRARGDEAVGPEFL